MSDKPFESAHVSEVTQHGRQSVVREHFAIEAFGVNVFSAVAGEQIVNEHTEIGLGARGSQEELYLVASGHATFTVDGERIDAPQGTIVFARDPGVRRAAVADEPGTVVLVVGAPQGQAFTVWQGDAGPEFWPLYEAKDYEGAVAHLERSLEEHPGNEGILYNLACCESLAGRNEQALEHLRAAIQREPDIRRLAREDGDFEPLRGDPAFEELIAGAGGGEGPPTVSQGSGYAAAHLDDVMTQAGSENSTWIRIRKHFDVGAFGVNAYRAAEAGGRVIEEHTESGTAAVRHHELYFVVDGRARFALGDEEVDAPAGTFVFVRDPEAKRGAHAEEPGTTVLAVGGQPGRAYELSPWEFFADARPLFQAKEYDGAIEIFRKGLERYPDNPNGLYNLACCESLIGRRDEALDHLARAVELDPRFGGYARDDDDFEAIRGDPRFMAAVAERSTRLG